MSKYRNALYVYLPSFILTSGEKKYLFVDNDGSTFSANESCNIQSKIIKFTISKIARASCGQIYPPRNLTFSNKSIADFTELNRHRGINVADTGKFHDRCSIEAIAQSTEKQIAWKIGNLEIQSDYSKKPIRSIQNITVKKKFG